MEVQNRRHIAKTISYRIISTGIGFGIVWLASGSIKVVYKPIQYYIHERVWYKYIKFGLKRPKNKII
jgi:uncharacterized membrane protein